MSFRWVSPRWLAARLDDMFCADQRLGGTPIPYPAFMAKGDIDASKGDFRIRMTDRGGRCGSGV